MLKSKIHRACATEANISYADSTTTDKKLMQEADILPYERAEVPNLNNSAPFDTYAVGGGKGEIYINGAAARLAIKGDIIITETKRAVEATSF